MTMPDRPSVSLYLREHPATARVVDECETPYEWGYEAATLDIGADLEPMTETTMQSLWHDDYTEGYFDAYADHDRALSVARHTTASETTP